MNMRAKARASIVLSAGSPMCSLCDMVNKRYNAVVATSRDRQVGYKVNADSLPAAFGYRKWL